MPRHQSAAPRDSERPAKRGLRWSAGIGDQCKLAGQTGVEMEALTAVSIAALTIYDMCKAMDKSIQISDIRLLEKSGGKSGHWVREQGKE